jgi:hypothetical protein
LVENRGIENFWSLQKGDLTETYVAVETFQPDAYMKEQVWRFNNSGMKMNGGLRFEKAYRRY